MKYRIYILAAVLLGLSACSSEEPSATSTAITAKQTKPLTVFNEQVKALEKAKELEQTLLNKDKKLQQILE
ncbi:MAG: hypothetical protein GQ582_07690 [Methyloprofundus sp.]|nr:hypothetical protein [Methyloprofundus sp.]